MAIPVGSVKLVFAGNLQGGEKFAHGFWFNAGATPISQSQLDANLAGATLTFNTQLGTAAIKALYPTTTTYNTITAYSYAGGPNVDLVSGPATPTAWAGTAGGAMPNQICIVMSLRSGNPGRSFRGRSYLPGLQNTAIGNDGQLVAANRTTLGNAWKAFLQGVAAGGGGTTAMPPIIMSAARSAKTPMLTFQIDSRMDVQRRRAAKQIVTSVASFVL